MSSARVLVVYCSKTGSTQSLAEVVGTALGEAGVEADVCDVSADPAPADYRAVIIGSGIQNGGWYQPANAWLIAHHEALAVKPLAVFTVGLHIRDEANRESVLKYGRPLLDTFGLHPVDVGMFAGWWQPEHFSWKQRIQLLGSKEEPGDWRNVDAVRDWSVRMAAELSTV